MSCQAPRGPWLRKRVGEISVRIGRHSIAVTPARVLLVSFATVILLGSALLSLPAATVPGRTTTYLDALFTSTSAVCVTGLIVVLTAEHWTLFGQIVILALIQIGGLGIMTMSAMFALLIGKRFSLKERLVMQEALGRYNISGLVRLTRYILGMTFLAELVGALLLFLRLRVEMSTARAGWYAVFHSVSAFCNAGFDLFGDSLERFVSDVPMNMIMSSLIIVGGLGFVVILELCQERARWSKLSLHSKLALGMTALLLLLGTCGVFLLEFDNPATLGRLDSNSKLLASYFHSVTPRTAGFNTLPTGELRAPTLLMTMVLMFVGASPGGTGGGIKTTTFVVVLLAVQSIIMGRDATAARRRLSKSLIEKSVAIAAISMGLVLVATFVLTITEQQGFLPVLFEATSGFGTVGLSMGITSALSRAGRLTIILLMLAGRVGPLTVAMAIAQLGPKANYHYPEEKVVVG